jgi:hypothetical protein
MRRLAMSLAALATAACLGANVKTATYANMTEAQPAIEQGLMPSGLPAAAYELRAAYVPDGSRRWGLFNFPPAAESELRALLDPEEIALSGVRVDIPPRVEWWPVQLRQSLDDERVKATGAKAYRATRGNLTFVVNWSQGRAYYFTPR